MTDPDLHRLVYQSRSALTGSEQTVERDLAELVADAAANNRRDGVTGALMSFGGAFLQVLEGDGAVLERVFERICCDLRHLDVQLIEFTPTAARSFGGWALQPVSPDPPLQALLSQLDGTEPASQSHATAEAVRLMHVLATLGGEPPPEDRVRAAA